MRLNSFLLSLFCLVYLNILGQNYSFISYSNDKGLPQSQVQCITQDALGYLWVGTPGGLAIFNGKSFFPYPVESGLLNNRISSLTNINGEIWVGHAGGVTQIVDGKAKNWSLGESLRTVFVKDIVSFKGHIIIATEGAGIFEVRKNKLLKLFQGNEDAAECRDLHIFNDQLLVATRDGLYQSPDGQNYKWVKQLGNRSFSYIANKKNQLYLASFYDGILKTNAAFSKLDSLFLPNTDAYITGCFVDKDQSLWVTSNFGVAKYGSSFKWINDLNGMPIASQNCFFQDQEGNNWFGSDGKGLLKFCGEDLVNYNSKNGMPSDLILATLKFPGEGYYCGSYDKGLFLLKPNGEVKAFDFPASSVWSIEKDGNDLWLGTEIGIYRKKEGKFEHFPISPDDGLVRFIERLQNGKIYFAGEDGLGTIEHGTVKLFNLNRRQLTNLGAVRQLLLFNGRLIAAGSNGLFEIDLKKNSVVMLKQFKSGVTSIQLDKLNRLWIGTESGLFVYDGISFKNVHIGNKSNARFINFLELIHDMMYIGTNNGVYVFDAGEEKIIPRSRIGVNSGLISLESNINSSYFDNRYLWFGTTEGLCRVDISRKIESGNTAFKPLIHFRNLLVNYTPWTTNENVKVNQFGVPLGLELPYNKNNITIDIDGILLQDPDAVMFQYWLEGQEAGWSPASSNSTISLSNLADGDYTLHIRAIDEMGNVSESKNIPIFIRAPFWRTWWFYLLLLLSAAFLVRSYFRYQIRSERERNYKENLENKTRLLALEQQSLNASMNRHFIFNSLNSIQYFINTQDKLSANRYLTSFAKLIRKNLDTAAEGDNMVSLTQELERLELYLSLEAMRFKDRFTYEIDTDAIDTDTVTVPAMLLQPFVENSIIHGILPDETKKGQIDVVLKVIANQLEICIDDNGIGIDFSLKKKASFAGDHKSQGMEITSKRITLIRTILKKDYELIGPFQMMNPDNSIKGTRVLLKIPLENLD